MHWSRPGHIFARTNLAFFCWLEYKLTRSSPVLSTREWLHRKMVTISIMIQKQHIFIEFLQNLFFLFLLLSRSSWTQRNHRYILHLWVFPFNLSLSNNFCVFPSHQDRLLILIQPLRHDPASNAASLHQFLHFSSLNEVKPWHILLILCVFAELSKLKLLLVHWVMMAVLSESVSVYLLKERYSCTSEYIWADWILLLT